MNRSHGGGHGSKDPPGLREEAYDEEPAETLLKYRLLLILEFE
jgi:hypothetical protein